VAVHTIGSRPTHAPLAHVSRRVQALPSSHAVPSALARLELAPVAELQVPASWH
jgi:hypothetical protein